MVSIEQAADIQTHDTQTHFGDLTDPRRREPKYPLLDMVFMSLCAVICGADDFVAIANWARTKQEWLAKFLGLSAGIDVTFGEDQCRVRKGHADANLSLLRRTALSLLKNEATAKVGIKNKRLTAAWNENYLTQVLFQSQL